MRRNELATDILKASRTQGLPPMLQVMLLIWDVLTVFLFAHCRESIED